MINIPPDFKILYFHTDKSLSLPMSLSHAGMEILAQSFPVEFIHLSLDDDSDYPRQLNKYWNKGSTLLCIEEDKIISPFDIRQMILCGNSVCTSPYLCGAYGQTPDYRRTTVGYYSGQRVTLLSQEEVQDYMNNHRRYPALNFFPNGFTKYLPSVQVGSIPEVPVWHDKAAPTASRAIDVIIHEQMLKNLGYVPEACIHPEVGRLKTLDSWMQKHLNSRKEIKSGD